MRWVYKKSKKGDKIQVWALEIEANKFRSHEGFEGGQITVGDWTICEGKNIGKKNETSPIQQAEAEARSRYQKKIDKGYSYDKENCDRPFEVTLAHGFGSYGNDIKYPVLVSPKLDGIRCYYKNGKLFTRAHKEIVSCPHISKEIEKYNDWKDKIIDGELYSHSLKEDFNKIISLTRKTKPTQEDLNESQEKIIFNIFDFVGDESYLERYNKIKHSFLKENECLQFVPHYLANDEQYILDLHEQFKSNGYEGSMIRWGNVSYQNGRTKYLLKLKDFDEAEFLVVGMLEGRGKRAGTLAKWVVDLGGGKTCEVNPTGSDEQNLKFWLDKDNLIGKVFITVKFQGFTPDGKLRFATFKAIRKNY